MSSRYLMTCLNRKPADRAGSHSHLLISEAKNLLRRSEKTIAENLAYSLGFEEPIVLSSCLKKKPASVLSNLGPAFKLKVFPPI